jgi:hypothetical protein
MPQQDEADWGAAAPPGAAATEPAASAPGTAPADEADWGAAAPPGAAATEPAASAPGTAPATITHRQETARQGIAYALLCILAIQVLFVVFASPFIAVARVKEALEIVFGPTAALVGSVMGFYFGANFSETPPSSGGAARRHATPGGRGQRREP